MIDTKKLEELLAAEKWDEAKVILEDYFKADWPAEDRGAVLANLASIYLEVNNKIGREYERTLDEAILALKEIKSREKKIDDKIKMAKIKSEI